MSGWRVSVAVLLIVLMTAFLSATAPDARYFWPIVVATCGIIVFARWPPKRPPLHT